MHRWLIGFYKVLEFFASRTFAEVQLVFNKTFNAHCSWLLRQGRCVLKRGSWLGTWWNLFTLIWMSSASFNKYQIALFSRSHYSHGNRELQLMTVIWGPPVILNEKQRTRSTTFSFFSFSCKCCRFFLYVNLRSTFLISLPWSTCLNFSQNYSSRNATCPISSCIRVSLGFETQVTWFWKHWISNFKVFMRTGKKKSHWITEIHTQSYFSNYLFVCPPPWWGEGSYDGCRQKR